MLSPEIPSVFDFSKYEEICAPQVEEFCYITDNTYCREEVCYDRYLSIIDV